jgi:hypothetical protein
MKSSSHKRHTTKSRNKSSRKNINHFFLVSLKDWRSGMTSRSLTDLKFLGQPRICLGVFYILVLIAWGSDYALSASDSASSSVPPATASSAQPPTQGDGKHNEGMQQMRQACSADAKKFCAQVKPGGGRILACLEEHSKEISPECSTRLEKRTQHQKDRKQ